MRLRTFIVTLLIALPILIGEAGYAVEGKGAKEVLLHFAPLPEESTTRSLKAGPGVLPRREPLARQDLKVLKHRRLSGPPPRQRSKQLSSRQIVVVGADASGKEISRVAIPDPRLIRAEMADESGKFTAKHIFFKESVDFLIALPDDPSITEIRIYHPHWTGTEFELQLVGQVDLP